MSERLQGKPWLVLSSYVTHHASRITHHASRIGLALLILSAASCTSENPDFSDTDATVPVPDADPAAPDANLEACTPSTSVCEADVVTICDGSGAVESQADCLLGCFDGERCNKLDPSNGLAPHLDEAANSIDVVFSGIATINTTSGLITDDNGAVALPTATDTSGPVDVFIVKVKSLTATDINVEGTAALAIVSDGDISISGIVKLSAVQNIDGPGAMLTDDACRGGQGATGGPNNGSYSGSGGGGGGFGDTGGNGGMALGASGGSGGGTSGNGAIVPLRGGCPGGHSENGSENLQPGGGGGVIQLVSSKAIALSTGSIQAHGGGGLATSSQFSTCIAGYSCLPGQGGGSGGGILLEAPAILVETGASLSATGGGGSCGQFGSGEDGNSSAARAAGGSCSALNEGNGGNGGAGTNTGGLSGQANSSPNGVGGGGGGGVGRIQVNLPLGTSFAPEGIVSPAATAGVLGLR